MSDVAMARKLRTLAQAELDTASVYEQALNRVSEPVIKDQLSKYRREHVSHFQKLVECIVDLGGEIPRRQTGPLESVFRELPAAGAEADLQGILRFLHGQETHTHQAYLEASQGELSLKAQALVDNGCSEEKQHLLFLEEALKSRRAGGGK